MRTILLTFSILLSVAFTVQIAEANQPDTTPTPNGELRSDNSDRSRVNNETSNGKGIKDYLRSVDETLDASLAATLAGLALAAAAFLLPLEQRKLDELKTAHQLTLAEVQQLLSSRKKQDRLAAIKQIDKLKTKVTSTEDEARLREFDQIDKALKILVWSFFFFAIALVDAILGDPLSDLEGVLDTRTLADLAVSGGGTIAGIACMVRSAFLIRRIVSPGKLEGEQNSERESAAPGETSRHASNQKADT